MAKRKTQTYRGVTFTHPEPYTENKGTWNEVGYAPTPKQFKNLLDMGYAIRNSPPPEFDMTDFGVITKLDEVDAKFFEKYDVGFAGSVRLPNDLRRISKKEDVNICGTSCCAIGTAAFHGVGKISKDMSWDEYSVNTFDLKRHSKFWNWLFSGDWANCDNTPEGAVARILMLIEIGPEAIDKLFDEEYLYDETEREALVASYQKYKEVVINDQA